jgi:hypothetical protein
MSRLNSINRHRVAIDIYSTQVISQIASFSVQEESPFIMVTEKVSSDTEPRHSQTIKHEFGGSHGAKASFTARITSSKQRKNTVENASGILTEGR